MDWSLVGVVLWILGIVGDAYSLPLMDHFEHSIWLKRLKRENPTGNVFDPPPPVFPSKENAPFWNPAPYPIPTTLAPPAPSPRRKLQRYDPNNPYLDILTDGYYPNFGLGYANQRPTFTGGSLNWPTGNVLNPHDHFNGTIGYATPQQLRVGMQGGPFYPYQSPQFMKTASDINDANALQQLAKVQQDGRNLNPAAGGSQAVPNGFIPVQNIGLQQAPPQQQLQQLAPSPNRRLSFAHQSLS